MTALQNPLIPGFNPDPSIVEVDGTYFLVTSTFEYLPGLPIYSSTDLDDWTLIGHVVTRLGQFQMTGVPTGGGAWAPTIRFRDGVFYVVVADAMGRGMLLFTATDPAGPWSDGMSIVGVDGIDPDLAWDDDGSCLVTYSALLFNDPGAGTNIGTQMGIRQVRLDLSTGHTLEEPRPMWSGTGLMFPEAPHLYCIGDWWYLLIAEGGTERGHAVSIARSHSPLGPFEGCPANPVLSARSTDRPVQNTGHGDLVQAPDGSWRLVLLGMRTRGMTRSFSSLGRETFVTSLTWRDGWPVVDPVTLPSPVRAPRFVDHFEQPELGPEWIAVRRRPVDAAELVGGRLRLRGEGRTMDDPSPTFVGRRQRRLDALVIATIAERTSDAVGGLSVRYDEQHHYDIEIQGSNVVARAMLSTVSTEHTASLPDGAVALYLDMAAPDSGPEADVQQRMTSDIIRAGFITADGERHEVGAFDGRFLSAESACSFTGRVIGVYCVSGELAFDSYSEVESTT